MKKFDTYLWSWYAHAYDSLAKYFNPYKKQIEDVTELVCRYCDVGGKILDAGCGTGNFSIALTKKRYEVVGFDLCSEMLKRATQKSEIDQLSISLVTANLDGKFPFVDNCFDIVLSINALYMLKHPQLCLQEFHRVLKPEGTLLISNPQRQPNMWKILNEIKEREGSYSCLKTGIRLFIVGLFNLVITRKMKNDGPFFYWDEEELTKRLQTTGFELEVITETYATNSNLLAAARKAF